MNQAEKAELLEQIEKWNDADEFARCIEAIEAIPEQERDYLLTLKLGRAYSNLAVLGKVDDNPFILQSKKTTQSLLALTKRVSF